MSKPLAGIRVIELANFIAGPLCGTLLADMGADVVKVEPPGGDMSRATPPIRNGESVSFTALNRNKRSLVLDLKAPEAQEVMRRLAAKSVSSAGGSMALSFFDLQAGSVASVKAHSAITIQSRTDGVRAERASVCMDLIGLRRRCAVRRRGRRRGRRVVGEQVIDFQLERLRVD